MRFLVQTVNGKIVHDFAFELERAKEYYDWRGESLDITYSDIVPSETVFKDDIPVGSVEFVSRFLMNYYPEAKNALLPLNVPECLFVYAKRKIANFTDEPSASVFDFKGSVFRKSLTRIKDERNGILLNNLTREYLKGFQVSEVVDILSEWRVLVFNGKVQHIGFYLGNPLNMPNAYIIQLMVKDYKNAPKAYTLDVGVNGEGKTFVIECHRFFSCGLYGFSDYNHYPKMLSQEWFEMKNMIDC